MIFSGSYALADNNIQSLISNWYLKSLKNIEEYLTQSIESEADKQKAILLNQVREQTEKSVKDLQDYAHTKQILIQNRIASKRQETFEILKSQDKLLVDSIKDMIDKETENDLKQIDKVNNQDQGNNKSELPKGKLENTNKENEISIPLSGELEAKGNENKVKDVEIKTSEGKNSDIQGKDSH